MSVAVDCLEPLLNVGHHCWWPLAPAEIVIEVPRVRLRPVKRMSRAERLRRGLCFQCGRPAKVSAGKVGTRCEQHAAETLARKQRWAARQAVAA